MLLPAELLYAVGTAGFSFNLISEACELTRVKLVVLVVIDSCTTNHVFVGVLRHESKVCPIWIAR